MLKRNLANLLVAQGRLILRQLLTVIESALKSKMFDAPSWAAAHDGRTYFHFPAATAAASNTYRCLQIHAEIFRARNNRRHRWRR